MRIDRIKFTMELAKRDMPLVRLSELTGVSRVTLTGIKGGKSCSDETGAKIATALGVKPSELVEEV